MNKSVEVMPNSCLKAGLHMNVECSSKCPNASSVVTHLYQITGQMSYIMNGTESQVNANDNKITLCGCPRYKRTTHTVWPVLLLFQIP